MITGLTYDDVLLMPSKSLNSRSEVSLETQLTRNIKMDIPIISANMDTVTGYDLSKAMSSYGGCGFVHRNTEAKLIADWVSLSQSAFSKNWAPLVPTVGVNNNQRYLVDLLIPISPKAICVDIANAYSDKSKNMIEYIQKHLPDTDIIVGNVASAPGALFLADLGVDAIKVGIGPGSVCTTRIKTGFGIPQFTAIMMVKTGLVHRGYTDIPVIADGGLKNSGDIVKALWAGASSVMSGYFFAGCTESEYGLKYRGMASNGARGHAQQTEEGIETFVDMSGDCHDILDDLCGGIRSGMSYAGCKTVEELICCEHVFAIRQTENGKIESNTRL